MAGFGNYSVAKTCLVFILWDLFYPLTFIVPVIRLKIMTARFLLLCFAAIISMPLVAAAQERFPLPQGWDEMDETRKDLYRDIWNTYYSGKDALKLSKEEKAALEDSEKKARYEAMWELRRGLHDELADNGFQMKPYSDSMVEQNVKAAMDSGESASALSSAVGSIVYDNGVGTTSFAQNNVIVGNRFDTFSGGNPVLMSGTVSTVIAVVAQGPAFTTSSAGFVLEGPQTVGGGAFAIFSSFTAASGAPTDTVTFTGIGRSYTGSSFFVLFGDFNNSYIPVFGTGTVNGQGHHGVIGYTGGMGPNITTTNNLGGNLNALVRAGGNILSDVPVELMKFKVESKGGESKKMVPKAEKSSKSE